MATFKISMEKKCKDCGEILHVTEFDEVPTNQDGYSTRCKVCSGPRKKEYRETHREGLRLRGEEYRATLEGHLGVIFNGMNQRCNNPKHNRYERYGGRGIQNKFTSLDEFRDYVTNDLGITRIDQIKGKQVHRINNNSHYMKGNIEFLTPKEHGEIHALLRKS